MSDTINREYATRYFIGLQALDKITNDNYDGKITFDEVIARLGVIPSAEPEIIRCKDCKHHILHPRMGVLWCKLLHSDMGYNQFCSYAERRGDKE